MIKAVIARGIFLSLSFAPPKESDQRKGDLKRQPLLFFAVCAGPFPAPKNRERFAPFPELPARRRIQHSGITIYICFLIRLLVALIEDCASPRVTVLLFLM